MQLVKTLSFRDSYKGKAKVVSVSFSNEEKELYDVACRMTSTEIKNAIGITDYGVLAAQANKDYRNVSQTIKMLLSKAFKRDKSYVLSSDVTFRNSKDVPFQRWYPYIEGYSPNFVKTLIEKYVQKQCIIYEPFAGTGTTLFAADSMGYDTYYSEINPLLRLLIDTKIKIFKLSFNDRERISELISEKVGKMCEYRDIECKSLNDNYDAVFGDSKYFTNENFIKILKAKSFVNNVDENLLKALLMIIVLSSLIPCSLLKKQGDLRFKTPKELSNGIPDFDDIFRKNANVVIEDLRNIQYNMYNQHVCIAENAKMIRKCKCSKIGCVITSPPYLNGTNYVRNTKLELWFMGILKSKKDLRDLRNQMITSGINDVKAEYANKNKIFCLSPLYDSTIQELRRNAYDKRIPIMAQSYFAEMYEIFDALRLKLNNGANVLIDIGDSIFNNVHIRTDDILAELLMTLGYKYYNKDKLRERRSRNGQILSQTLLKFKYGNLQ